MPTLMDRRVDVSGDWVEIIHNGMESVYLIEAQYKGGYRIFLRFNTGEAGEVDLEEVAHQFRPPNPYATRAGLPPFILTHGPPWRGRAALMWRRKRFILWRLMATGKSLFCSPVKV